MWADIKHKYILNTLYILPGNFSDAGYCSGTKADKVPVSMEHVYNLLERDKHWIRTNKMSIMKGGDKGN